MPDSKTSWFHESHVLKRRHVEARSKLKTSRLVGATIVCHRHITCWGSDFEGISVLKLSYKLRHPNFFLVGASKAGTTSLAHALSDHPQIYMTKIKEPNFFNHYENEDCIKQSDIFDYLELYKAAQGERILGEASVSYLSSIRASEHIAKLYPDAKILISLRNPLERIVSLYEMYVRHGLTQSFEQATVKDPWLVKQCLYADSVRRYVSRFPRHNIHFTDFNSLKDDWMSTLTSIQEFLKVGTIASEGRVVRNVGGLPRNPAMRLLYNRKVIELGKLCVPTRLHSRVDGYIKRRAFSKFRLSDEDHDRLSGVFSADVTELDSILGSDFHLRWFGFQ